MTAIISLLLVISISMVTVATFAVVLLVAVLLSKLAERTILSTAVLFLATNFTGLAKM